MIMTTRAIVVAVLASLPPHALAQSPGAPPIVPIPPPIIYSIDPSSGPPGSTMTIVGFGFAPSNKVQFGDKAMADVPIAWAAGINCIPGNAKCHPGINQGLVVRVPAETTAGTYPVSVENANGASNPVPFAVE